MENEYTTAEIIFLFRKWFNKRLDYNITGELVMNVFREQYPDTVKNDDTIVCNLSSWDKNEIISQIYNSTLGDGNVTIDDIYDKYLGNLDNEFPIITKKYHFCASHKYGNDYWSKEKNWSGSIEFDVDGIDYEVKVQRSGASTKVQLFKTGTDISDHKVLDTYKRIHEIIGLDFEVFYFLILNQNSFLFYFCLFVDQNAH
mgnify:CR=1 FL=1